jgi:UDP-glucose 4-epimerase
MSDFLVTGGCGFIGSHLVDALVSGGHRVRVLDNLSTGHRNNLNSHAELVVGEIVDTACLTAAMAGVDACFHVAAIASVQKYDDDWVRCHAVNLGATVGVFEAARHANGGKPIPVIYASSAAVYGDSGELPLRENSVARPISAYGADKLGCELHGRVARDLYAVPTLGLRLFNVYGPRQDPSSPYSGVISIFSDRIARAMPLSIFGDGEQTRDFIYVGDVVAHFLAGLNRIREAPPVLNVCTGRAISLLELVRVLSQIAGRSADVRLEDARAGDIRHSLGDPRSARDALRIAADTELTDGLRRTLTDQVAG